MNSIKCPLKSSLFGGIFFTIGGFLFINSVFAENIKFPSELGMEEFDYKLIDSIVEDGYKGVLSAFIGDPKMYGSRLQRVFYLRTGQDFEARYMIQNLTDSHVNYWIICMVNYEQRKFQLSGNSNYAHFVSVAPGERRIYPFHISGVDKGAHDLLLLCLEQNGEDDSGYLPIYHRANIFVNSYSFPKPFYRTYPTQISSSPVFQIALNIRKEFDDFTKLFYEKKRKINDRKYFAHIINHHDRQLTSALVGIVDLKQINFSKNTGGGAKFYKVHPHAETVIKLKPERQKIGKSFFIINVENPYVKLESSPGELAQVPSMVRVSNKVEFGD